MFFTPQEVNTPQSSTQTLEAGSSKYWETGRNRRGKRAIDGPLGRIARKFSSSQVAQITSLTMVQGFLVNQPLPLEAHVSLLHLAHVRFVPIEHF